MSEKREFLRQAVAENTAKEKELEDFEAGREAKIMRALQAVTFGEHGKTIMPADRIEIGDLPGMGMNHYYLVVVRSTGVEWYVQCVLHQELARSAVFRNRLVVENDQEPLPIVDLTKLKVTTSKHFKEGLEKRKLVVLTRERRDEEKSVLAKPTPEGTRIGGIDI